MWRTKTSEEEDRSQTGRETSVPFGPPVARLGQTVSLKGELVGREDLLVDGELAGTIELGSHRLTVGPDGRVEADIHAREITIEGTVRGKLRADDRLKITRTGNVIGELVAGRIMIEDGAYFKGSIDIQKPGEEISARADSLDHPFRISPAPPTMAAKDKLQ